MRADGRKWNTINQSPRHHKAIKKLHYGSKTDRPPRPHHAPTTTHTQMGVMLYLRSDTLLRIYAFGNVCAANADIYTYLTDWSDSRWHVNGSEAFWDFVKDQWRRDNVRCKLSPPSDIWIIYLINIGVGCL